MSEQLALIDTPAAAPKLTDRQQAVHDALERAGHDGITADEAGAILCQLRGRHTIDDRCEHDGQNGKSILRRELEPKGLVIYRRAKGRRPGAWVSTTAAAPALKVAEPPAEWDGVGPCPHNHIPF